MATKQVRILAVLAVALAGVAWFAAQRDQHSYAPEDLGLFAPELESRLGEITAVNIHAAGADAIELQQAGEDRWILPAKTSYPIDLSKLREVLRNLATAEVIEAKTANPDWHERLKLQDIGEADDTTVEILAHADGEPVLGVLIGRSGQGGQYVRKIGENQTWLINKTIRPAGAAADWLDKTLVDIKRAELARVSVQENGEQVFALKLQDADSTDFELSPALEQGRSLNTANSNRLLSALSNLQLLDVRAAQAADESGQWRRLDFVRQDGLHVEVEIRQDDDKHWLRLSATVEESTAADTGSQPGTGEPSSATQASLIAQQINGRAAGRVFEISSYPGGGLLMEYDKLLRDPPAEDPDA